MDQGGLWHGLERYGAFSFSGTRGPVNGCDGDGVHVIIVVTPLNVNVQLEQVDSSLEVEAAVEEAAVNRSSGGGPEFEHALMTTELMMMVKSRTLELSDDVDVDDEGSCSRLSDRKIRVGLLLLLLLKTS